MGLVGALAIALAAHNLGALLLARWVGMTDAPRAEQALWRTAIGLGALGYLILGLGALHLISPTAGWLLVVLSTAAGVPALLKPLAKRQEVASGTPAPRVLAWAVAALVAGLAVNAIAIALAPPSGYDELTYHLAAPKIYARTGGVPVLPWDHHTAFCFTLEMLYTLGLLLGGAGAAKLVHVLLWALSLLAIRTAGRQWLGDRGAWLAVLIVAATPLALTNVPLAYTEFGVMLYAMLALYAFERWRHAALAQPDGTTGWLVVAGACAGLSAGIKITAGLLALVLVAAALVQRGLPLSRRLRAAGVVAGLALVIAAPWLVRSWAATGNPVFPFADGVFHSPAWSADRAASYDQAQREFGRALDERTLAPAEPAGSQRSFGRLLTSAWNATFHPSWFFDVGHNMDGKARLGPAYLAFGLPLLILLGLALAQRRSADVPRAVWLLLAYGTAVGLFWFVSMQHLRYLVPTLAVYGLLAAWAAEQLHSMRLAAVATAVVLAMQAAGGLTYSLTAARPAWRVHAGTLSAERYAAASLPSYEAMAWINNNLPQAKVALYGEPRGYWLDVDYLWAERNHNTLIPDSARATSGQYLDYLRDQLHVTHVLVNEAVVPLTSPGTGDDAALLAEALRDGRLRMVFEGSRWPVRVYELVP